MSPVEQDEINARKRRAGLLCRHPGCDIHANFGLESSKKVEFCGRHADRSSMINLRKRKCHHQGCMTFPYFGVEGTRTVEFCGKHAKDGMVDVGKNKCAHPQCEKYPSYGVRKGKKAEYCAPHAPKNMVPVFAGSRKTCSNQGCAFQANFGVDGTKEGEFCSRHAPDGMVNVFSKRCGHPDCAKYPSYGVEGTHKTGEFCAAHKKEGMVIVSGKRCKDPECRRRATHGMGRSKTRESCVQHATVGMVKIQGPSKEFCHHEGCTRVSKAKFCYQHTPGGTVGGESTTKLRPCLHPGCTIQASCGVEGSSIAERCALHAAAGMVIVQQKAARRRNPAKNVTTQRKKERCHDPDCNKRASCGVRVGGSTKGEFCPEHAKEGMVSMYVNFCGHQGCNTSANYGAPGTKKAEFCARHAGDGMVNVYAKNVTIQRKKERCHDPDCSKRASCGVRVGGITKGEFCPEHAKEGMVSMYVNFCGHQGCNTSANYGAPGTKKGEFCARHAGDGMINLNARKCAAPDCMKFPSYGSEESTRATFCAKHAEDGMVSIRRSACGNRSRAPSQVLPHAKDGRIKPEVEERCSRQLTPQNPCGDSIAPAAAVEQPFMGYSRKRARVDSER